MPIFKDEDGILWLNYGYGDIYTGTLNYKDTGEVIGVAIFEDTPTPIGTQVEEHLYQSIQDLGASVCMKFDKIESLEVVVSVLQETLKQMKEQRYGHSV